MRQSTCEQLESNRSQRTCARQARVENESYTSSDIRSSGPEAVSRVVVNLRLAHVVPTSQTGTEGFNR